MTTVAAMLLADVWPYGHHMGTGGWIVMMVGMIVFWGAIIALVVWAIRGRSAIAPDSPTDILRRRLADGSITVEEYEQRRAALDAPPAAPRMHPR